MESDQPNSPQKNLRWATKTIEMLSADADADYFSKKQWHEVAFFLITIMKLNQAQISENSKA